MSRKPLSNVDLAWLRMDDPNNLMIITGIMIFDAPLDSERLKATIEQHLFRFERFRQRVVYSRLTWRRPYWQDDPLFDLNAHIQRVVLPPPADQDVLQELISVLMSVDLDHSRPLWQFYLVEKYGEGSALICRLHHCIADGIALMQVLLSMTDTDPNMPGTNYQTTFEERVGISRSRFYRTKRAMRKTASATAKIMQAGSQLTSDPNQAWEYARLGGDTLKAAARIALRWPDPQTVFKGPLGYHKCAAWSDPISLDEVKRIGRAYAGTVNDVLLSIVTGALRRYLQYREEPVDGVSIRGFIPVNLRPIKLDRELGNRFGLVFLTLPVGYTDPLDRLKSLKRNMDGLKGTPEAVASFGILNLMGAAPSRVQDVAVSIFDTKGSAVMTNVPGPKVKLYLAGAPLKTVMAWVPQSGRIGLGVSIISYNGQVWLGIATDRGLVPDPERILAYFVEEFETMRALADTAPTKRGDIKGMLNQLDNSIQILDEMLQDVADTSQVPQRKYCQAQTRSGRPCKNAALPGEIYCQVHLHQEG